MKKTVIYLLFAFAAISCTTSRSIEVVKGNWLNANDSIEWVLSFQPEFVVYKNQFWEYDKITGSNRKIKILLKNQGKFDRVLVRILNGNSISVSSPEGKECPLTRSKAIVSDFHNYDTIGFGNIEFRDAPAVVSGFIEDYDPDLFNGTGSVALYNAMNGFKKELTETNFTIDTNGRFEVSIRAYNPQLAHLAIDGSTYTQAMISPGDTVIIGFNRLLKTLTEDNSKWEGIHDGEVNHYMGKYAMLSEEIIYLQHVYSQYIDKMPVMKIENIDQMPQLDYIGWRKKVYTDEMQEMDSLLSALRCSNKARQYFNIFLENELLSNLYRYQISGSRIQQLGPLYTGQIPEAEFSVTNMLNQNYLSFINYLIFYEAQNPLGSGIDAVSKYYVNYLLSKVKNTDDHQLIINLLEKPEPIPDDFDSSNNEDLLGYDRFINRKISEMNKDYNKIMGLYSDLIPDSVMRKAFLHGLDNTMQKYGHNLLSQIAAAYRIQSYLQNLSLGADARDWILKNFSEPVVQKVMLEKLDRKIKVETTYTDFAENTQFIDQIKVPENPAAFFDTLISQFKGKVIYIDFWADWCSPCREGFKSVKKLKKVYTGKDVVFLYLGYNCKKENWDKAIMHDQVSGYHYWLDKDQSALIKERFGIIGIPHYLLVDKKGVVSDEDVPGPASRAAISFKLDEMLDKQ